LIREATIAVEKGRYDRCDRCDRFGKQVGLINCTATVLSI